MKIWDLDTPCLLVDYRIMERNVTEMAQCASQAGKGLRPHVKTHKCTEIARLQAKAGACGVTVAKVGEAEVFAASGFSDIFVANLVVGHTKVERLLQLSRSARLAVGIDSVAVLRPLLDATQRARTSLDVLVEVDTGHGRAGVRSPSEALEIARAVSGSPNVKLVGVYTHEGHAYRANPSDVDALARSAVTTLTEVLETIAPYCDPPPHVVSVGSTPTAAAMCRLDGVTEIRPGNYVFRDATQVRLGSALDTCALTVLTTVIARPSTTEALLDAGTKALSGDRDPRFGYGYVQDDPAARLDWCSEEHAHLHLGLSQLRPAVSQKLRIVPAHACTCVNMHPWLWIVEDDRVLARWPVSARDRLQ